jgi:signal transduction histidine kinase
MAALPGPTGNDRIAGEQAALRRVATLVARGAPPEEVFAAVTEEAGRLLGATYTTMARYDPDGARTVVAACSGTGPTFPVGNRMSLGGRNVSTLVFQRGRAARIDDYGDTSGPVAEAVREFGFRAAAGVPVRVEGRLWGVMVVASTLGPLPADTEAQLAGFTELAATAIANAQARVELSGFADEQAALRRVATLIARAAAPKEVLAAVAEEAGRLLGIDYTSMARYDPDGERTVVAAWSGTGAPTFPVGSRVTLGGYDVPTLVLQTERAARIDDYSVAWGPIAEVVCKLGFRAVVGVPVRVEGKLWGVMMVQSRAEPLPAGTEERLAGFTELAATAIANAQARVELRGFADEQAALRRVATLVAGGAAPEEVLTSVTEEAGRLLGADYATTGRYGHDGAITVVAAWSSTGPSFRVGTRAALGGRNLQTMIFQTRRPARIDKYASATGSLAEAALKFGVRAAVGVPVSVEGRLWGELIVGSRAELLPAGTEDRLAGFTELGGTAIANAEAQAALTASRARIVATADATRRRIERNLHDGAQQRLVSLALELRAAQATAPAGAAEVVQQLDEVTTGLDDVLDDLREIARGLHPAILAESGLAPALKTLARRSAVPVDLNVEVQGRLPEPVETAAYYTVSEALTNAAKHARATTADIQATEHDGLLYLRVHDNGRGGADFGHGSGLVGLKDRAEALGGHLQLHSPPGVGTTLQVTLPLDEPGGPQLPPGAEGPPQPEAAQRSEPGPRSRSRR